MDIVKRSRRNYGEEYNYPDNVLAQMYWSEPVKLGVFLNSDAEENAGASKRTDTPLHPVGSGSGSGDGSFYFKDSAKRDSVPKPNEVATVKKVEKVEKIEKAKKVEMAEKKSELTAKATESKVEVQGEGEEEKRHNTVTCQGQKDWLQCPMYHLIKINSAFWGRDDENSCSRSGVEHGLKTNQMCAQDESNTMVKLQNACDGESACELVASPVYFDRTDCPDVYKFLRVNWECAHSESRVKDIVPDSDTNNSTMSR